MDDKSSGSVEVFGETHTARVGVEGLTKRWNFGENFNYSFVINPDGFAAYYDFSHNDEATPSMAFHCALVQPSAEQHHRSNVETELSGDENQRRLNSLQGAYKLAIFNKVKRNWIRPAGSEKIPECWVRVLQGPGGIILDVTIGTCTGSTATYRASIENAFYKAIAQARRPILVRARVEL